MVLYIAPPIAITKDIGCTAGRLVQAIIGITDARPTAAVEHDPQEQFAGRSSKAGWHYQNRNLLWEYPHKSKTRNVGAMGKTEWTRL